MDNTSIIFDYLYRNGIYYAKDLFLLSYDEIVKCFEKFKNKLGVDFAEM